MFNCEELLARCSQWE